MLESIAVAAALIGLIVIAGVLLDRMARRLGQWLYPKDGTPR